MQAKLHKKKHELPRAQGVAALILMMLLGCRTSGDERPVVTVAASSAVEARFAGLRSRWLVANAAGRGRMKDELALFVQQLQSQSDGLEPIVRAYLALAYLYQGIPVAAEATSRILTDGPPGVAHDLGMLVRGVAARRLGRNAEAIEILRPLVGKLIDAFARPLVFQELVEALLAGERWDEALVYSEGWLRAVGDDRDEVAAIRRVVARIPADPLLALLGLDPTASGHSKEMGKLVSDELTRREGGVATSVGIGKDESPDDPTPPTRMAAPYLDHRAIGLLLPSSLAGQAVLATAAGRAVGFVLVPAGTPVSVSDVRSPATIPTASSAVPAAKLTPLASGELALGTKPSAVASAKEPLPPPPLTPPLGAHRLVVFDTGGTSVGTLKALEAAERGGVAVVVGGVTDRESDVLAEQSFQRRIPMILFRRPTLTAAAKSEAPTSRAWVALAPSVREESERAIQVGGADLAVVYPTPGPDGVSSIEKSPQELVTLRCDSESRLAGEPTFSLAALRTKSVATLVLLGDPRCSRRVLLELALMSPPFRPRVVLAPSSIELAYEPSPFTRIFLVSGKLPLNPREADVAALWKFDGAPLSYMSALGRDAALMATLVATDSGEALGLTAVAGARATLGQRLITATKTHSPKFWTYPVGFEAASLATRLFLPNAVAPSTFASR